MKKHIYIYVLLFLVCIVCFSLIVYMFIMNNRNTLENFEDNHIPKKIWTFWDNPIIPDIIDKCIGTWKKHNPNYEIIVLNKNNLNNYLPEVDFSKIKHIHNNSPEKFSDMVRLHVLAKYGGIWSDASIICLKPYDYWINLLQKKNNSEFVGFYIDGFTLPEYREKSPVIENWFFACKSNSMFVKDWLKEFLRTSDFNTIEEYVENVKEHGVNFQKITSTSYLSMHIACQKILQKQGANYKIKLLKAEDTAYKYLTKNDWDTNKALDNLLACKNPKITLHLCDILDTPIIKMRRAERIMMEQKNYLQWFV